MDIPLGFEIAFIVLFLLLHAFFSLLETSVLTVRKSRLREMQEDENVLVRDQRRAKIVLELKKKPEQFIAAVQSGEVLTGFLSAAFAAIIGYEHVGPTLLRMGVPELSALWIAFTMMLLIITLFDLTFGALIPKSVALNQSLSIALFFATTARRLVKILRPFTGLPVLISNIILRPFKDHTSFLESRISEEEFRVMLEEGARTGVIDKTENELIENIFDFRERTAREIMIPRTKIVAIDIELPPAQVADRVVQEGYTRLPVYQGTIDNIIGVIYSKDVLALLEHPELIILFDIIRKTPVVPETKLISELLREFQREKLHMAIIVDEFGGTAGVITLEDILEEIVGEIHDESDEEMPVIESDPEHHSVLLNAMIPISDANEELEKILDGFEIPSDEEYESVSGFVNKLFGYIPAVGEVRETRGVRIIVVKRAPNRVLQVRFEKLEPLPVFAAET